MRGERLARHGVAHKREEVIPRNLLGRQAARRAALLRLVDLSDVVLVEGGGVQGVETVLERARNLAPEFFAGSVTTTSTTQTSKQ
mgnify:CR=1 FL=1